MLAGAREIRVGTLCPEPLTSERGVLPARALAQRDHLEEHRRAKLG
jgi:hypothetical protein